MATVQYTLFAAVVYIALALLVVMTLPLPNVLRTSVLNSTRRLLHSRVALFNRQVSLLGLGFLVSATMCVTALIPLLRATELHRDSARWAEFEAKRLRHERNFWMSATGLVVFWAMYRYSSVVRRVAQLEASRAAR